MTGLPFPLNWFAPNHRALFSFRLSHDHPLKRLFLRTEATGTTMIKGSNREEKIVDLLHPPTDQAFTTRFQSVSANETIVHVEFNLEKLLAARSFNYLRIRGLFARDERYNEKAWDFGPNVMLFIEP
jgi:hypothetical protein